MKEESKEPKATTNPEEAVVAGMQKLGIDGQTETQAEKQKVHGMLELAEEKKKNIMCDY